MSSTIVERVEAVRKRAYLLRVGYGVAWVVGAGVLLAGLLGTLDFLVRSEDLGVRSLLSFLLLSATVAVAIRYLRPALTRQLSHLEVAQQIELSEPQLTGRLSSAVAFTGQSADDRGAGSSQLRRLVITEVSGLLDDVDLDRVLDYRPAKRALIIAAFILLVAGGLFFAAPATGSQMIARLMLPWSNSQWPREHYLEVVGVPYYVAGGTDCHVSVVDRSGVFPENVTLLVRRRGNTAATNESLEMQLDDDSETVTAVVANVTDRLEYRAIGGDDRYMKWHSLRVVDPPQVSSVQFKITPPAYTGWPSSASSGDLRVLVGTQLEVVGQTTGAVDRVELHAESDDDQTVLLASVNAMGNQFQVPGWDASPWIVAETIDYRFSLAGRAQADVVVASDRSWQIEAVVDATPQVSLSTTHRMQVITAGGVLPLVVTASDDIGLHDVQLEYQDQDMKSEILALAEGPDEAASKETAGLDSGQANIDRREIAYDWDLSKIADLQPGMTLSYLPIATDYLPQRSQGQAKQIRIVSDERFAELLAERQSTLLEQLSKIIQLQRDAHARTVHVRSEYEQAPGLSPDSQRRLQSAETTQRLVRRELVDPHDGMLRRISRLLGDLHHGRIDDEAMNVRLTELHDRLAAVEDAHLTTIEHSLVFSLKSIQEAAKTADQVAVSQAMESADTHQQQVLAELEKLQERFLRWDRIEQLASQTRRLLSEQQTLVDQTTGLQKRTAGQDLASLEPTDKADLSRLGRQQAELARRTDRLLRLMQSAQSEVAESQPVVAAKVAATLADAMEVAQRQELSRKMNQIGSSLSQNQLGKATTTQRSAVAGLQELLDALSQRPGDNRRRLEQLQRAAEALDKLSSKQDEASKQAEQAANKKSTDEQKRELEKLSKLQKRLKKDAATLKQQLNRMRSGEASQSVGAAGECMGQCAGAAQAGDPQQAKKSADQAKQKLAEAKKQLDDAIEQAKRQLQHEQLVKLEQVIAGLRIRQEAALLDTKRLDRLRQADGTLTPGQSESVELLSQQQADLFAETASAAADVGAVTFEFALQQTGRLMVRSGELLRDGTTDEEVQQPESEAVDLLTQVVAALKAKAASSGGGSGAGGAGSKPAKKPAGKQPPPGEKIAQLSQLVLLRSMQESLNRRSQTLFENRSTKNVAEERWLTQRTELAEEQGRLADVIVSLISPPPGAKPKEDPAEDVDVDGQTEDALEDALEQSLDAALEDLLLDEFEEQP